jgi:DNA transformation protein
MDPKLVEIKDEILEEVFGPIAMRITSRGMFGGYGLYLDNRIFAIITSTRKLYLKVGDNNRADFESYGSKPFTDTMGKTKKVVSMPYWNLPEEIMQDPNEASSWAEKSALNSEPKKSKK